jgi:hypothetical protein
MAGGMAGGGYRPTDTERPARGTARGNARPNSRHRRDDKRGPVSRGGRAAAATAAARRGGGSRGRCHPGVHGGIVVFSRIFFLLFHFFHLEVCITREG